MGADGRLAQALLLEVAPGGRITRLELAGPAGLLTLHPEPDDTALHGNVVLATGLGHLAFTWSPEHVLLVGASPVTAAVAAAVLSARVGAGEGTSVRVVEVGDDLAVRRATWRVARVADRRWHLLAADGGRSVTVTLDGDGLVAGLDDAATWPMELPPTA